MTDAIEMDRVAREGVHYSPWGYVIAEDGTCYSLTEQWAHGVVLSLLYPKEAEQHGVGTPGRDFDVFAYQRFELDHHDDLPVIRISMLGTLNISKSDAPASQKQIETLTQIFRACEVGLNETVQTDLRECTARAALKELQRSDDDANEY